MSQKLKVNQSHSGKLSLSMSWHYFLFQDEIDTLFNEFSNIWERNLTICTIPIQDTLLSQPVEPRVHDGLNQPKYNVNGIKFCLRTHLLFILLLMLLKLIFELAH